MPFYVVYIVIVGIILTLNIALGIFSLRHPRIPGTRFYALACFTVAQVAAMFIVLTLTDSPEVGYASARLRFFGLGFLGPLFLLFAIQYTQNERWLTRGRIAAFLFIPVLMQLVIWSPEGHRYFFTDWELIRADGWSGEYRTFGLWYNLYTVYSVGSFLGGVALITRYALQVDSSRRSVVLMMLLGAALGLPGLLFPFDIGPEPGAHFTPIAVGIVTIFIGVAFLSREILSVLPVAYDLVFGSMDESVILTDAKHSVIKANPAAERLFNRPLAQMVNQPIGALMSGTEGWPEGDSTLEPFELVFANGGEPVVCRVQRQPMIRGGDAVGYLIVLRDVTAERKAFELSLEQERSRLMVNFITDASHEFRTPLSIIKTSAYLLGKIADSEKASGYLNKITVQADRVNTLVDDLQTMSELDSTRQFVRQTIDIRPLINNLIGAFAEPLAKTHGLTLTVDLDPALPNLPVNAEEIKLALRKVLDNALAYTPHGGTISVSARTAGTNVCVTVQDSGVGMDEKTLKSAATRFFRGDAAHSTAGFGLGLPIAQRVAERHGGALAITSAPNSGTTVVFMLPVSHAP